MVVTEPGTTQTIPALTPPSRNRYLRIGAVAALILGVFAATSFAYTTHASGEYRKRDDTIRILRIKADKDKRDTDLKHTREIAALNVQHADELRAAVAKQKRHDVRVLRRAARRLKVRERRAVAAAQNAGYSSGSAAGYASGHSTGVDEGLVQGSDSLDCSDDVDVYWLPSCY
jgi:hypothetical protein